MTGIQRSASSYSFLKRDSERARYEAQQVQTYHQVGKIPVITGSTSDESTTLVPFGNIFVEEPNFTFGSVLDPGTPAVGGKFPTLSVTVIKWSLLTYGPASFYQGAFLGIVTSGIPGQKLWVHYSFLGSALSFGLGTVSGGQVTA